MVNGKRRRKVIYGKTRAEVNRERIKLLNELQRGVPIQPVDLQLVPVEAPAGTVDRLLAQQPRHRPEGVKTRFPSSG
jgi:hypothetical protein